MNILNLISFLSKKLNIPKEEIERELKKKIEEYNGLLTEEGALALIAKEKGIDISKLLLEKRFTISFLTEGLKNVEISLLVGKKFFESEKGIGFYVYDDTGKAKLYLWRDAKEFGNKLREGDIVRVKIDKITERGIIEIHVFSKNRIFFENRQEILDLLRNIETKEKDFIDTIGLFVKFKNKIMFYSLKGTLFDVDKKLGFGKIYRIKGFKEDKKIKVEKIEEVNIENLIRKMMNDERTER